MGRENRDRAWEVGVVVSNYVVPEGGGSGGLVRVMR